MDDVEKLDLCWQYCNLVKQQEEIFKDIGTMLYSLNQQRIDLHYKLLDAFNIIDKSLTYDVTTNLEIINYDGRRLKNELEKLSHNNN